MAHLMYAVLFTGEMFIRITAAGPKTYFVGNGWAWNWLDVFVGAPTCTNDRRKAPKVASPRSPKP